MSEASLSLEDHIEHGWVSGCVGVGRVAVVWRNLDDPLAMKKNKLESVFLLPRATAFEIDVRHAGKRL